MSAAVDRRTGEWYLERHCLAGTAVVRQYIYEVGSYHYNWHPHFELRLVLRGEVEACADGTTSIVGPGDLVVVNSNEGHATLAREPDALVLLLHTDPALLAPFYGDPAGLRVQYRTGAGDRDRPSAVALRALLAEMMLRGGGTDPADALVFERNLLDIWALLVTHGSPRPATRRTETTRARRNAAIEHLRNYIDAHYTERLTLQQLAEVTSFNPSYVSQLFSRYVGMGFVDYLTRIRVREATRRLGETDDRVVDIALANGFGDVKAFNVAFRKTFAKSPTEYRRQLAEGGRVIASEDFKKTFVSRAEPGLREQLEGYVAAGQHRPGADGPRSTGPDVAALRRRVASVADAVDDLARDLTRLDEGDGR